MGRLIHSAAIVAGRFILSQCVRVQVLNRHCVPARGPFLLACTHLSHLEPFVVSSVLNRHIDWMARVEFFRNPLAAKLLRMVDSFPVNRQGVPVSAIRSALQRLGRGRIVGMFPEGGVATGTRAVIRGGAIKQGVCLIANRARVPIIPAVVIGTEKLNCVQPWLPMRRGRLWLSFGKPVMPVACQTSRRLARRILAERLQCRFVQAYRQLCQTCRIDDAMVP
jgi:1-acyl-sn-glycerol-3-phosphate acyltransferase